MGHAQAWATDKATICTPAGATTPKSVTAESTDKPERKGTLSCFEGRRAPGRPIPEGYGGHATPGCAW